MSPSFIFRDFELLARCSDKVIESEYLPFFDLLPDESARPIEVVVGSRPQIQQHGR